MEKKEKKKKTNQEIESITINIIAVLSCHRQINSATNDDDYVVLLDFATTHSNHHNQGNKTKAEFRKYYSMTCWSNICVHEKLCAAKKENDKRKKKNSNEKPPFSQFLSHKKFSLPSLYCSS